MSDDMASRYRVQDATYWQRTGTNSSGRPTYAAPVDIKVRWEDKNEQYTTATGEEYTSKSIVLVGQDMKVTDRLRLGTVATLPAGVSPDRVPGSHEIEVWHKIPNSRASKFLRRAVL